MKPVKLVFLTVFMLMAFAQWWVPGKMIWQRNNVLKNGKAYKFQSMPVDPVHPFQGRYVALDFAERTYTVNRNHGLRYGQKVYLRFTTGNSGYAKISSMHRHPPGGTDYIEAEVDYINDWNGDSIAVINIKYPFEEYYTEEFKAPRIEKLYGDSSMQPGLTYAVVKVYKGNCVIEDLYINNKPVEELLK